VPAAGARSTFVRMTSWKLRQAALMLRGLRPHKPSPLGAFARGLVAGAAGAGVQSLFFRATSAAAPEPSQPPPREAKPDGSGESELQTLSRRFAEGLMLRGPLEGAAKDRAASATHYLFGAAWGGLYGLWRETARAPATIFGLAVWMLSDNVILPLFRLSAWPHRYSPKEHAYAAEAHIVYGLATAAAYALLRDIGPNLPLEALPALAALQLRAWWRRTPPVRLWRRNEPMPVRFFDQFVDRAALA
jgi:hypothetical protein